MPADSAAGATARPELVRAIGRWSFVALVINCIIGSGIFGLPSVVSAHLGAHAFIAYLIAGAGMVIVAGTLSEVASQFHESGGPYLYARETQGRFIESRYGNQQIKSD